ncbi:MAG: dihydroorotase [Aquabacterium sp.]
MTSATNGLVVRGGRVIDPLSGRDERADVWVAGERIYAIAPGLEVPAGTQVLDAAGCIVMPGLVDLAVRLREPGQEHEGMLESELAAAAAGGVTSLVCLPDTDPVLDEPGLVEMLKFRARRLASCRVFPLGALTRGLAGQALTEMAELTEAGCIGFSQAEVALQDHQVLLRALQYAATFGYTVWLRPQDASLGKGVAAAGEVATRLGLAGVPVMAETLAIHAVMEMVRVTRARVHLCRLSSAAGVALVRAAKAEGLPISADVSINSLHLTDVDIGWFDAAARLTPPLRQARDRDALRAALADGTLDALVSDHTPVAADAKVLPFAEAEPGASGLELLLSLALKWGQAEGLDLPRCLAAVSSGPAAVLGGAIGGMRHSAGRLQVGGMADLCVFDPAAIWMAQPSALRSQGKHTPFAPASGGTALPGRVRATVLAGALAFDATAT